MKTYILRHRFYVCLCISFLLHLSLILFLLMPNTLRLKQGTSQDTLAKIPGFKVAGGEILKAGKDLIKSNIDNPIPNSKEQTKSEAKPTKSQNAQNAQSKQTKELLSQSSTIEVGNAKKTSIYEFSGVDNVTKQDISELYGEEFGDLGTEQQNFIANNLRHIGRITQSYLRYPSNAGRIGQKGINAVEFMLHPNGDISDLKLILSTGFRLLDRNSQKTIEIAYKDYPRPKTTTLIRIKVIYNLY